MKTESQKLRAQIKKTEWDGKDRLRGIARRVFGTSGREASRNIRMMLTQIVGRVMKPGFKTDQMVVLVGDAFCGKSRAVQALGGSGYMHHHFNSYSASLSECNLKTVVEIEISPEAAFQERQSHLKDFISSSHDRYREPYAKFAKTYPRQFALIGTSNTGEMDEFANRRILWTPVGNINTEYLERYRLQIFAQVHTYMRNGAW